MTVQPLHPEFFIVGTGRSGTTLARAILTGHPDVEVHGETWFLPLLLRLRPVWWGASGLRQEAFLRLAFANGRLQRAGLHRADVERVLLDRIIDTPQGAISALYEAYGGPRGATVVGDKTPGYVDHARTLGEHFPQAKFIEMVRHPLDVVCSLMDQPWGPNDPAAAAIWWDRSQRAIARSGMSADRLLIVRLEDLIDQPDDVVGSMAAHLGLDVHPDMVNFTARAGQIADQNIHPSGHVGLRGPLRRTRSWTDQLTPRQASDAWAIVAGSADALGYEGPDMPVVPARRRAAGSRLAMFRLSRSWRRLRSVRRVLRR